MRREITAIVALWSGLTVLGACTPLPDLGPFVQSTAAVRSAVITAGTVTIGELWSLPEGGPAAEQVAAQWPARVRAMDGLVAYADTLHAIVVTGSHGANTVGRLAESVSQLAAVAGLVLPASGTAAVVSDAAHLVTDQVARMRAATALEHALAQSQPAIAQILRLITHDLADLGALFQAANAGILLALTTEYNAGLGFRQGLLATRNRLYAHDAGAWTAADQARLLAVQASLTAVNEWYVPYTSRRETIQQRLVTGQLLFQSAAALVAQWGGTYAQLVQAVHARRPVSTVSLLQAAGDLRDLVQRMRAR